MLYTKVKSFFSIVGIFVLIGCSEQPVPRPQPIQHLPVIDKNVNVTGAAGELKRLTYGGSEELVSSCSNDNEWLLLDTFSIDKGVRSNNIIQKLNIYTGQKMILTPANSSNSRAIWSKDNNSFIFNTNRAGTTIAESMGVNGENGIRFVTHSSLGKAHSPSLNEQKNEIAFVLNESIALVNLDGTQIRMFGEGILPKFSKDGEKILFIRHDGNFYHIFLMNVNGTSLLQLTNEPADDFEAVWSPDNTKIAFISNRANKHKHLYVMDINTKNLFQLTDGNYDVSSLDWGNDGYIYFSANAGGNRDVWRLKIK